MRPILQLIRFLRVCLAARAIQDYLWGGPPGARAVEESWESWVGALDKRIAKLYGVRVQHPSWRVETRKRLLQIATVAVGFIEALDHPGSPVIPPAKDA